MNLPAHSKPFIAIACGGTGGHLFPGMAVAGELQQRGCDVALLISPKDVDQQAVKSAVGLEIYTLPAVGLQNRNYFSFARSFWKSFQAARTLFKQRRPDAVLAMGGFTSAPPVLAARSFGAKTFLHDSNTIPGKANRFLARLVDEAFVGFPEAASRLRTRKICVTGTPVRSQFQPRNAAVCRQTLGLDPARPTILVVGGSQGASGLNDLILSALQSQSAHKLSGFQFLHLTGVKDFEKVKAVYAANGLAAVVKPFLAEMELALGAATACVSRAGASSLAEIAAMRLPSALVPLPTAADNHQWSNARAFETTGAARLWDQKNSPPDNVLAEIISLATDEAVRSAMQAALVQWHAPKAAEAIAENILSAIGQEAGKAVAGGSQPAAGNEIKLMTVT